MEGSQNTLRSYALALLTLVGNQYDQDVQEGANKDDVAPFGMAMRLDTQRSKYHQTSHTLLQALIEHSPSPESVSHQFLTELIKCENSAVENSDLSVSPDDWAVEVNGELNENNGNISFVKELADYYLTNLVIAFRNLPGGTPRDSLPPSPDLHRMEISALLDSATVRRDQAALKELALRRDGPRCLITRFSFVGRENVPYNCAHIIPFTIHDQTPVHSAIEMFTANEVSADTIHQFINHPANAINMHGDPHISMDMSLAWGIEARSVDNEVKYYFRVVRPDKIYYGTMRLNDGDEMEFGKGDYGFAEVVDNITRDNDGGASGLSFSDDLSLRLAMVAVRG
ncbi:hypothetical protein BJV74DRAFT_263479 [Russula compacta]|nr:hypothetical protein BJV74DRAFT_263479 [Russula compacta]